MNRFSMYRLLQPLALVAAYTLFALFAVPAASAQGIRPQPQITAPIDGSPRVPLVGSRPPRALAANDIGAVPGTLQLHGISLLFSRSAAQQAALDALVAAQQNPASPLYHQWITPDQFAAQFGVADSDLAAAKAWLEQQGFSVDSISRSHNRILFSGTAAQVASAFGAPLHYYLSPATEFEPARTHFAPSADLTLPAALASSVLAIGNLSDFHLTPHLQHASQPEQPRFTSSQTGSHYLTPGDLATIYDISPAYNAGFTGSNQSIAVVGQSAVDLTDIANFQTAVNIPGKTPIQVLVPNSGTPRVSATGDEAESDLDLEYSSTIAKGAQVYFVYTGDNKNYGVFDSIVYAVDERIAPIISSSYGSCEPDLGQSGYNQYNSTFQQAAAQGQTVLSAAGDDGSTDCYANTSDAQTVREQLAVDYPASSQYVTAVGGTEFSAADVATSSTTYFDAQSSSDIVSSAKSYIPEVVWNNDSSAYPSSPLSSGGGGVSIFSPQPTWQTGTIAGVAIPNSGNRMLPDIALTASPVNAPFAFCTSDPTFWASSQKSSCTSGLRDSSTQDLTVGGGTSFEAPTVAGLVAIINQAKNSTGQGVINPTLYSLAATSVYATAFHDITTGGNNCTAGASVCVAPATTDYPATTGYDEASGLGSIDFNNLLTAWPSGGTPSALLSTSTTLTAATTTPAAGATDAITITVASAAANPAAPSGTVSVSVDGGTATSLPLSSGIATYSFSSTTLGAHVVTATYSGDTLFATSSGTLTLSVGGAPAGGFGLAVNPGTATVTSGSSTTGVVVITPINGYTGTVTLTASSTTALTNGCIVVLPGSVSITGSAVGNGTYAIYTSPVPCPAAGAARPGSSTGSNASAHNVLRPAPSPWRQLPLPLSLAGAFFWVAFGRRPRSLRSKLLSASLALGLLFALSFGGLALSGCGGGSSTPTTTPSTPPGTYTIIVTGTDSKTATITGSATITLTVN